MRGMIDTKLFDAAFLKAKRNFKPTGLKDTVKGQNYKYAKIGAIYSAVEDALADEGIVIHHMCRLSDKTEEIFEILYTYLIHGESGQYVYDERLIQSEQPGNKGRGAGETYAAKRAVLALCAIATEEDDDCASETEYIEKNREPLLQELKNLVGNNRKFEESILKFNKVKSLDNMTIKQIEGALKSADKSKKPTAEEAEISTPELTLSQDQIDTLNYKLESHPAVEDELYRLLEKRGLRNLSDIQKKDYLSMLSWIEKNIEAEKGNKESYANSIRS